MCRHDNRTSDYSNSTKPSLHPQRQSTSSHHTIRRGVVLNLSENSVGDKCVDQYIIGFPAWQDGRTTEDDPQRTPPPYNPILHRGGGGANFSCDPLCVSPCPRCCLSVVFALFDCTGGMVKATVLSAVLSLTSYNAGAFVGHPGSLSTQHDRMTTVTCSHVAPATAVVAVARIAQRPPPCRIPHLVSMSAAGGESAAEGEKEEEERTAIPPGETEIDKQQQHTQCCQQSNA